MQNSILIIFSLLISLFITQNLATECGEVQLPFGLVANGNKSRHGQWPWLVSLHIKRRSGHDQFFCGASLINEWALVTGEFCKDF